MNRSGLGKKVSVLCLSLVFLFSLICGLAFQTQDRVKAESASEAYFVTEDRYTQGFWYNGENGLKDNPELDRNYGNDGLVLFFHWLRQNGQQTMDVEALNDFTNDSGYYPNGEKVNYVEYPSYVSSIEGNITSINDDPFGYWMNTPQTMTQSLKNSQNGIQPLPIEGVTHDGEEFTWSHGGFQCGVGGTTQFTVQMTDDEWHMMTYYVGCPWRHKYYGYDAQWIKIYDLNNNLIAQHCVDNVNQGVHVRFAVKGSFILQFSGQALAAYSNAMFFDPYTENTDIGTENLSVELEGSKTLNLSWTNKSDQTYTSVFRRIKGETLWDVVAEVEPGVSTFTDETASVSTEYEYALASGTEKRGEPQFEYTAIKQDFIQPEIRVKTYNLPDFEGSFEIGTAQYKKTEIEYLDSLYGSTKDVPFTVRAKLTRENDDATGYENYAGVEVTFTLEGDNVYTDLGVNVYPNMDPVFGKGITNEEGIVEVEGSIEFAGEYELVASIQPQPDPENDYYGYDSSETTVSVSILESESENPATPFLMSVTDAVKPGNSVYIVGHNIADDGELKVAYIKNKGQMPSAFDETEHFYYLKQEEILFVDSANGTGIMFTFPETAEPGLYDFYVHNKDGWSNGITMNAARPLYLDQEGAYEGQEIQIVGRNFLQYEYGVGDLASSYASLKVKITQVANEDGNAVNGISYILTQANGGILTGNKVDKENAMQFESDVLQAEDIPYTHTARITIKIPAVHAFGTYEVTVAANGKDFREMVDNCKLVIYPKKAQNWNTEIFGSYGNNHNGNDPLDLGVYWAQDLNYSNVVTINANDPQNTFDTAQTFTAALNAKISALSKQGGGIIYFPEGTYYLYSDVEMKSGVMLVGAGVEKTRFEYCDNTQTNKVWFKANMDGNLGIARVSLYANHPDLQREADGLWYAPKYVLQWSGDGRYDEDTTLTTVKNRFFVDIKGVLVGGKTVQFDQCQRLIAVSGKNCLFKNSDFDGALVYTELEAYGTMWNVKYKYTEAVETSPHWNGRYNFMENCYFDMCGMGHGPSIKSNQYVAYTYITNAGNREEPTNDGEVLLMEAPSGTFSVGKVLTSTKRSITLDFTGGSKIGSNTAIRFNMMAVYISEGTGAGQYRYIKKAGTGDYTNCYELMDWEKDWDILPDSTSVFSCIAPLANMTVYHLKAYDCVSSICIYQNHMDTLVDGCTLVDTAGITGGGLASGGMKGGRLNPFTNIRIVNNDISGVGSHTNQGAPSADIGQSGGIQIYSGGSGEYMGLLTYGITIRDNYLHDLLADEPYEDSDVLGSGLMLYFKGGQDNSSNGMRYIIVENNIVEGSERGLSIDRYMTGVVVKDNAVSGTTLNAEDVTIDRPLGLYASADHTLYVGEEKSNLSGEYEYGSALPVLAPAEGKVFVGWTTEKEYEEGDVIVMQALGHNVTLYAVFGYEVLFDYNYLTSDKTEKGEFVTLNTVGGQSVKSEIDAFGEPFRVGYTFGGWYKDRACTQAFDTDSVINANTTVFAKWIDDDADNVTDPIISSNDPSDGVVGYYVGIVILGVVLLGGIAGIIVAKKKR